MATGRHGEYREHKYRGREMDLKVASRKESYRDRNREGGDRVRSRPGHDVRDRFGNLPRDAKESRRVNGFCRSSPGTSCSSGGSGGDNGYGRRRLLGRSADKEPGELSSGSGSDDTDAPGFKVRGNGVSSLENGTRSPPAKKRKFSPIVWDRDDGKQSTVGVPSQNKDPEIDIPQPPPLLPEEFVSSNRIQVAEPLEPTSPMDPKISVESTDYPKISVESTEGQIWGNEHEPGQLEEDEDYYLPARTILASRWADRNNAFEAEQDEGFTETILHKEKKSTPSAEPVATRSNKKVPTPELEEVVLREFSERAASTSSVSRELGEEYQEFDIDKKDHIVVDEEDEAYRQSVMDYEAESDLVKPLSPIQPPQRCINMLQSCRSVDEFERLNKINEGTYGIVFRAKDKKTGEIVALKKVKIEKEREGWEGFPLTSLREINILLSLHHPSIVDVKEVVVGSSLDSIFMVMEYMEHDLKGLMEAMKQPFSQSEVKCLMLQLLEGMKYLHNNWVLHRDLKTSNLLLNNHGELKICDFGLSRQYGSPLKPYTHFVVTLWYRAPELLLGAKEYSTAIDMWSLGCIMAELLAKEPLFSGKTEFDQLDKIFRVLGTPIEKIWPGFAKLPGVKVNFVKQRYNRLREKFPPTSFSGRPTLSEAGFDLLNKLLTYDPDKRITAEDALNHGWFREVPLPKSKDFMPTFPAQNAQDRRLRRILKSPDPLEEQRMKELQQGEIGTGGLFG